METGDGFADGRQGAGVAVETIDLDLVGHLVSDDHELLTRQQLEVARELARQLRNVLERQLAVIADGVKRNRVVATVRHHQNSSVCRRLDRGGFRDERFTVRVPPVETLGQHRNFLEATKRRAIERIV